MYSSRLLQVRFLMNHALSGLRSVDNCSPGSLGLNCLCFELTGHPMLCQVVPKLGHSCSWQQEGWNKRFHHARSESKQGQKAKRERVCYTKHQKETVKFIIQMKISRIYSHRRKNKAAPKFVTWKQSPKKQDEASQTQELVESNSTCQLVCCLKNFDQPFEFA